MSEEFVGRFAQGAFGLVPFSRQKYFKVLTRVDLVLLLLLVSLRHTLMVSDRFPKRQYFQRSSSAANSSKPQDSNGMGPTRRENGIKFHGKSLLMYLLRSERLLKCESGLRPSEVPRTGYPTSSVPQVFHHLNMLMRHSANMTKSGQYLEANLQSHQLETGTSYPLLQPSNTGILASETWLKRVWVQFDALDIRVEFSSP